MNWLPCPDCWSEQGYISEQYIVIDSYGAILEHEDGSPVKASNWPPDTIPGQGHTVKVLRDGGGKIISRVFLGCTTCGGSGECFESDGDSVGKNWYERMAAGDIIEGSGKIPKEMPNTQSFGSLLRVGQIVSEIEEVAFAHGYVCAEVGRSDANRIIVTLRPYNQKDF